MGGTDVGASLSASSSATSGATVGGARFGDFIVGGRKPLPAWMLPIIVVSVVLVASLWLLRKH